MNDNEEEVVQRDKEQYPHCHHTTSLQQFFSYSSTDGQTSDTVKTILRLCPGERPVPIFKKSDKNTSESSDLSEDFSPAFGMNDGLNSIFNSFFGDDVFGLGRSERGGGVPSVFGFDGPLGGFFGHYPHEKSRHRSGEVEHFGGGDGIHSKRPSNPQRDWSWRNRIQEDDWFQEQQDLPSVMQPPHALPKGTSPSVHQYQKRKDLSRGGPKGEAVSPPENI